MKLFVANLPRECTEDELKEFFSSCGTPVSVKIIMDRETGQSRGFGFVEMSNRDEGQRAVDELNEKELGGRPIAVKEAKEQQRRDPRSGGGGRRFQR